MAARPVLDGVTGVVLDDVLHKDLCKAWIAAAESVGFQTNGRGAFFAGNRKLTVIGDSASSRG